MTNNLTAPNNLSASETASDELDRLTILSGKIGMNTPEQALALLHGLDDAYRRIQDLEAGSQSRQMVQTQLDGIIAALRREAMGFIRDLGGAQALRQARAETRPPEENVWWYLDTWLAEKGRKALRRALTVAGVLIIVLAILGAVYQRFLAPDPKTVAVYSSEQSANQSLRDGDLNAALKQVDEGLKTAPDDPELLTLKGVILEAQGQTAQAGQNYAAAKQASSSLEQFLVTRGQDYTAANRATQALADAQQAVQINPRSAQGYLLMGQAHEMLTQYRQAMDDYDKAYQAANETNQPALAAIARQRTAVLYQMMGAVVTPELTLTPTQ